jgi:hypothetical protein
LPVFNSEGDFDPRNHKSFIIPGYEAESLGNVPPEKWPCLASLLFENDELQLGLDPYYKRWIAIGVAADGSRAKLMADVAKADEALRFADAENRAQRASGGDEGPVM